MTDNIRIDSHGRDSNWSDTLIERPCSKAQLPASLKAQEIIGQTSQSTRKTPTSKGELVPYNIAIKNAAQTGNICRMERIYANIISNGLLPDIFTYTPMIRAYAKAKRRERVEDVWNKMSPIINGNKDSAQNLIPLKCSLFAFARFGDIKNVRAIMQQVTKIIERPDHEILAYLLMAYSMAGNPDEVRAVMQKMKASNISVNEKDYVDLIVAYGKQGKIEEAEKALKEFLSSGLPVTDVCFNELAEAYLKNQNVTGILKVISMMKQLGIPRTDRVYNTVIRYYVRINDPNGAKAAYQALLADGVKPSNWTYSHLSEVT